MFGILISALNTLLGFVFRSLIIKFVVFFALYFVVQGFVEILVELLPDSSNLSSLFANLSDGFWYFNLITRLSGIMVMALKRWCLILVYQVQIYQLQLDEQA